MQNLASIECLQLGAGISGHLSQMLGRVAIPFEIRQAYDVQFGTDHRTDLLGYTALLRGLCSSSSLHAKITPWGRKGAPECLLHAEGWHRVSRVGRGEPGCGVENIQAAGR